MRSLTQLREDARVIFDAGVSAADPIEAVKRHFRRQGATLEVAGRRYELSTYRSLFVVGAGKASAKMTRAVEEVLGEKISRGMVIVQRSHALPVNRVEVVEAGHPLPDDAGVKWTRRIMDILEMAGENDLVIFLISGGASALLPSPVDRLTLEDKRRITEALLGCGATIQEINIVRKHISKVKGGRLAGLAYPATVVSLILSDVVGDPIEDIASGPTAPDPSTYSDCLRVIERYQIGEIIPPLVRAYLERGARGEVEETPKAGDAIFHRVQNVIVGNNELALEAARQQATALGYNCLLLSSFIQGEARVAATFHAAIAKEILTTDNPISRPACVVSGGETTVTVRGTGLGGRNQEFALAAAIDLDGVDGVVVLSGGTDGTDGPTDAAGGIVDGATLQRARARGIEARNYLDNNDSYHFLQATGDLLITGPTFTNVMDLRVMLIG